MTVLCEGGYAQPARPNDGEFVEKIFERTVETERGESATEKVGHLKLQYMEGVCESGQPLRGSFQSSVAPPVRLPHQCGDVQLRPCLQIHIQVHLQGENHVESTWW